MAVLFFDQLQPRVDLLGIAVGEFDQHIIIVGESLFETSQGLIVEQSAFVDHDNPVADLVDIHHIVGGQNNRGALFAVQLTDEKADFILYHNIQPDGGLVEIQNLGVV